MSFTSKQREILEIAKQRGYVTMDDFVCIFSSPISRKANLDRFIALGILTPDNGKFKLNADKLNNGN